MAGCYGEVGNHFYDLPKHQLGGYKLSINDVVNLEADTTTIFRFENGYQSYSENTIIVESGDKINVTLDSKVESGFIPSYLWEMHELSPVRDPITNEYPKSVQIGNTKDIEFNINGAPIKYCLTCTITNTKDGSKDYVSFIFQINKPNGVIILYEGANGADFDMFKSDKNTVAFKKPEYYRNVFSSTNGSYIKNPKLAYLYSSTFLLFNKSDMMTLNTTTYKVASQNQIDFFAISAPTYSDSYMLGLSGRIFAVFDGEVYYSSTGVKFSFSIDPSTKYKNFIIANDATSASTSYWVLFDEVNKKFRYADFNGKMYNFVTAAGSLFDISDTRMDFIYGESGYRLNINAIMKKGDKLLFNVLDLKYGIKISSGPEIQEEVSALEQYDITSLPGISDKSLWAMSTRAARAFYSSGSTIYLYNYENNTTSVFATVTGNISLMKVFKITNNEDLNSKTLYVGTEDNKLYEFSFDVITGNKIGEPIVYPIDGKPIYLF